MQIWLAAFRNNTAPVSFAPSLRADIVSGRTPLVARSAPLRKQNGTLEIEKNLGVPEKQYIVGNCDYLLVSLAASERPR
jgi:hypothetical protein